MNSKRLTKRIVIGLGSLAITLGSFASHSSTQNVTRTTSSSSSLLQNSQGLKPTSLFDWCPEGEQWYSPFSSCVKNEDYPPKNPYENLDKIKKVEETLEASEYELNKMKEKLQDLNKFLDEYSKKYGKP